MMSRRILINLAAFVAVSALLVAYGLVSLLGNPVAHKQTLYTTFPDASGMRTNFAVTLNGVDIGTVSSITLAPSGVRIGMSIDPGVKVPVDAAASIDWANALGEQQVDLIPEIAPGGNVGRYFGNGAQVPVAQDGEPAQVGEVVRVAAKLLASIPVGDLNNLLTQLSEALNGRAGDLRTIIESSDTLAREFLAYQAQFEALLNSSPPILNAVADVGPQLVQSLQNTEVLTRLLATRRFDLVALMANGADASAVAGALVSTELPNLACAVHDFSRLTANIAQAANLANLATGIATNQWFFGAINAVAPEGRTIGLYRGDVPRGNQEWLRTRLLEPPGQPAASPYNTPVGIPPTLPGAACDTSEFGAGIGAASQAGGENPVPGAAITPPTPEDAHVAGGNG